MPHRREPANRQTYTNRAVGLLHHRARGFYRAVPILLLGAVLGLAPQTAFGQTDTPIYVDDAPSAETAISRARELASVGNISEAIDVLQRTLNQFSGSVTESERPDIFISVRQRIHDLLLNDAAMLERYRTLQNPQAEALLRTGDLERVERLYLLTTAGCDAALRLAQRQLEDAKFQAAALTLLQIDRHPDRTGDRARAALQLLATSDRYFGDNPADRALARRAESTITSWSSALGVDPPPTEPIEPPADALTRSAFATAPAGELEGMLSRPLASDRLGEPNDLLDNLTSRNASRRLPPDALVLHALPTIYRDSVIVNDSVSISSWNRFTLKLNWRVRVEAPIVSEAMGTAYGVDDLSSVQVVDDTVIAVTGLSMSGRSAPERYVIALDARTGQQLWGTSLAQLNVPELATSAIRGRPSIDQGVIVLNAVRHSREQRVISTTVFGLDLRTGELLWTRPAASIGVQPYGWNVPAVDAGTAGNGLVYRTDTLGVTTAIESVSGRTRWIRRFGTDGMYGGLAAQPWMNNRPVLHSGAVFTVSPGADRIYALDAVTGETLQSTPSSLWGGPAYLLSSSTHVVGVSENEIYARPYDPDIYRAIDSDERFATQSQTRPVPIFASNPRGIRGRVVAAGDKLIVPTDSGVTVVEVAAAYDAAKGEQPYAPVDIRLENPGQVAAVDGQLVVADDHAVHSYSLWSVAERYLSQAMEQDPTDPDPAITFAELSYQADQGEAILPAVDHALRALGSDPLSEDHDGARTRLFHVILEMISPQRAERAVMARLTDDTRAELINRLSLTASLPTERVAYMMAAGDYYETSGQIGEAIDMYQRTLESEELASATVELEGTGVPAGVEATRRMRRLIATAGRDAYALYDSEAERAVRELPEDPGPADYESIARRFPLAEQTPDLWTRAGEAYLANERIPLAVFALEEAATAAEIIWPADDPRVATVYSRVVAMMLEHNRVNSAIQRIRRAADQGIPLAIAIDDEELDTEGIREFAVALAQRRQRRPVIGEEITPGSTLEGWVAARLESPGREIRTDRIVMRRTDARIGVFAQSEEGDSLVQLWGDVREELPLRIDGDRLILATVVDRAENMDHIIRARDLDTGEIVWESQPFRAQFGDEPMAQPEISRIPSVQTPLRSRVRMNELTYNFDGSMMTLFERSGRALAIDLSDGRTLWTRTELMDIVHDIDANAGLIVVAGSNLVGDQWFDVNHRPEDRDAVVHVLEARTGRTLHTRREPVAVRWVRVTPEAEAILGLEDGIVSLDAHRGMVRWRNEAEFLSSSRTGLPMAGKFIVRGADNLLWMIDPASGTIDDEPLDVRGRLDRGFGRIEVTDLSQNFAVATDRGVVILNAEGETVGADASAEEAMVIPAAFGAGHFVHITRDGIPVDENFYRYRLTLFALPGAKALAEAGIELQGDPATVSLLDDMIIVSAYRNSIILSAPALENPDRKPRVDPTTIRPIIPSDVQPEPDDTVDSVPTEVPERPEVQRLRELPPG
jgi:outer membrane protein assembly factor BamB